MIYNPSDWYWAVGGDPTQVYSSARGVFVSIADAQFVAWKSKEGGSNRPTPIDTSVNLGAVLAPYRLRPTDSAVLAAYQQAAASAVDLVQLRLMFNHENRIRALESKAPITQPQFLAAISALL
jgi:hypothetical protein